MMDSNGFGLDLDVDWICLGCGLDLDWIWIGFGLDLDGSRAENDEENHDFDISEIDPKSTQE